MVEALDVVRIFLFYMQIRFVSLQIDLSIEEASSVIRGFKLIVDVAAAPDQS